MWCQSWVFLSGRESVQVCHRLFIVVDPATLWCLSHARAWIYNVMCRGLLFVFREWRWEMLVRLVDTGGIIDHLCLTFLFIMRAFDPTCSFPEPIRCQMFILHSRLNLPFCFEYSVSSFFWINRNYYCFGFFFTSVDNYIFPWRSCAVHLDIY